jgi:two-component sensor histidine kinase
VELSRFVEQILSSQIAPRLRQTDDSRLFQLLQELGITSLSVQLVCEELFLNAQEHGQTAVQTFAVRQADRLYLAFLDRGPGIHQTLPRNPRLSDLRGKSASSLLRLSVEEGITGTGVLGRGVGLSLLSRLIQEQNGEAVLISDGGLLVQVGQVSQNPPSLFQLEGTLVAFTLEGA